MTTPAPIPLKCPECGMQGYHKLDCSVRAAEESRAIEESNARQDAFFRTHPRGGA